MIGAPNFNLGIRSNLGRMLIFVLRFFISFTQILFLRERKYSAELLKIHNLEIGLFVLAILTLEKWPNQDIWGRADWIRDHDFFPGNFSTFHYNIGLNFLRVFGEIKGFGSVKLGNFLRIGRVTLNLGVIELTHNWFKMKDFQSIWLKPVLDLIHSWTSL